MLNIDVQRVWSHTLNTADTRLLKILRLYHRQCRETLDVQISIIGESLTDDARQAIANSEQHLHERRTQKLNKLLLLSRVQHQHHRRQKRWRQRLHQKCASLSAPTATTTDNTPQTTDSQLQQREGA